MKVRGIHHVTLRSQDPEVARRFYQEVVGLEFMEIPVSGEVTSIWKGAPAEGVLLAAQAGETFLVIAPPLEGTASDDRFSEYRIGLDHLAFAVENRASSTRWWSGSRRRGSRPRALRPTPRWGRNWWRSATRTTSSARRT